MKMPYSMFSGLGGVVDGSFFRAKVDQTLKPGSASFVPKGYSLTMQCKDYLTAAYFFYSPNLVWFLIAAVQWLLVPFDPSTIQSKGDDAVERDWRVIAAFRVVVNCTSVLLYTGFWQVSSAVWCSRPFANNKLKPLSLWKLLFNPRMLHNIFYTTLGAVQWGLTETAFMFGYSSGYLQAYPASASAGSWSFAMEIVLWILLVPVIRDVHFYFCHRFLHVRVLYKYIHAVHHRNAADTDAFSGLCMHPVEHLYYFACYGPLLWVGRPTLHPFVVSWMGVHALLAPAASHSGYEDHWSADLHHYLHHRYYECNYGSSGLIMTDLWMGTLRETLDEKDRSAFAGSNSKATLVRLVSTERSFMILGAFIPSCVLWIAMRNGKTTTSTVRKEYRLLAIGIAVAPLIAAVFLHTIAYFRSQNRLSLWKHYLAPFDRDTMPSVVMHSLFGGFVCCIWPVYSLLWMLLS